MVILYNDYFSNSNNQRIYDKNNDWILLYNQNKGNTLSFLDYKNIDIFGLYDDELLIN